MSEPFQILAGFLAQFGPEVEGREIAEPPEPLATRLRSLAQAALPPTERAELFEQLKRNPQWIDWLARELKARRPDPAEAPERDA